MDSMRIIATVALYEARTLWRSWFFRIFAGLIVLLLIVLNSLLFSVGQFSTWVFRAIPANIPYANILILNLIQSIVAIIQATDFMKRDRSMDTADVIYIRSMTNTSYVAGKACGNLIVFACLNVAALLCAAFFNFFSGEVPFQAAAYCYYALLISLPTLVFCVGLTFFLMSIIRSQPLTLVGMFGLLGLAFFFLPDKLYSLFDFAALRTPLMFSDVTGFGALSGILLIRSAYLLSGVAFVLIASLRLKRLPQSTLVSRLTLLCAIALGGAAVAAGSFYVHANLRDQKARALMIERHNRQFEIPCVSVVRDALRISHAGNTINATALVTVSNQTSSPLDEYQFRLNPGLAIREIHGSHPMGFRRSLDYVFVKPAAPLPPASLDTVVFTYDGTIDESVCYLDVPPEEIARSCAVFFFQKQPRYSFINKRFVLLTPESQFYPQAGAGFCSNHPEVNPMAASSEFSVTVSADPALTVISQGQPARTPDGMSVFTSPVPLPGISVIIGPYAKQSLIVDSVEYGLLTLARHDYFKPYFKDLKSDTVASLVRGLKTDFENRLKFSYPYARFFIVEVPVQFTEFSHVWTSGHEAVQPEIALFPENGFSLGDVDFRSMRQATLNRRRRDQEIVTPQEQQSMMFQRFVTATFQRDNAGRRFMLRSADRNAPQGQVLQWLPPLSAPSANLFVFPDYFSYVVNLHASACPVFSSALESYYKKRASGDAAGMMRMFTGGASTDERVNMALGNNGFDLICKDPENRPILADVVQALGDYLITVLQKNIGGRAFDDFMQDLVARNRFKTIDLEELCATVKRRFNFDFRPTLQSCYTKHPLPGFLLDNIEANEVRDKTADRFLLRFEIANPESAQGLVKVSVRTGSAGQARLGGGGGNPGGNRGGIFGNVATIDRIVSLDPGQCKEIDMMMDQPPRMLSVNTLISKNIPATIVHSFDKVEFDANRAPFDGERMISGITALDAGSAIVDDEDSGFSVESKPSAGFVTWFKNSSNPPYDRWASLRFFDPPAEWTEAVGPLYYGKYIHSVHYIKSGSGAKRIAWRASIKESGTYEIFAYYAAMGFQRGNNRRQNRESVQGSYHYIVHHDDGTEDFALNVKDIQNGWNSLGRYHLSLGTALVELTDQGSHGIVIGDAIKWVKQ
jgi:hypothetical protein